jgi:hypothetical protein
LRWNILVKFAAIASLSVLATGCGVPDSENMAVKVSHAVETSPKFKGAMAARNITGGDSANHLWTLQVDNASFKAALEKSLAEIGYNTPAGKKPRYFIDADLKVLDRPFLARDFDVSANVIYYVEKNGVKKKYPINAVGTASASEAFTEAERLRIASERAIQENIKFFFTTMARPE